MPINVPSSALTRKLAAKKLAMKKKDGDNVPARSTKSAQDKAAKDLASRTDKSGGVKTKTGDYKMGKPSLVVNKKGKKSLDGKFYNDARQKSKADRVFRNKQNN